MSGALWRNLPGLKEEMEKPDFDPFVHYQLQEAAETILGGVTKYLKNDFEVQISGHGIGAVVAMMLAPLLKEKGFIIDGKVVTFAQPRVFLKAENAKEEKGKEKEKEKEKEAEETTTTTTNEKQGAAVRGAGVEWYNRCLREVPLLRVNLHGDPTLLLFPNCENLGAEILLLAESHFAYSEDASLVTKDPSTPPSFRFPFFHLLLSLLLLLLLLLLLIYVVPASDCEAEVTKQYQQNKKGSLKIKARWHYTAWTSI